MDGASRRRVSSLAWLRRGRAARRCWSTGRRCVHPGRRPRDRHRRRRSPSPGPDSRLRAAAATSRRCLGRGRCAILCAWLSAPSRPSAQGCRDARSGSSCDSGPAADRRKHEVRWVQVDLLMACREVGRERRRRGLLGPPVRLRCGRRQATGAPTCTFSVPSVGSGGDRNTHRARRCHGNGFGGQLRGGPASERDPRARPGAAGTRAGP